MNATAASPSRRYRQLYAECCPVEELPCELIEPMLSLFRQCYLHTTERGFHRDLAAKSHVILIFDGLCQLKGFSTFVLWRHVLQDRCLNLLFSGDTVIEPSAWGQPALPQAFLSAAGGLHAAQPDVPLYWILTTKGHRTFRFMPLFFHQFYPSRDFHGSGDAALAKNIGSSFFKDRYDVTRGVIVGDAHSGCLAEALANIPVKDQARKDVQYFLERNPGYRTGDELLCIARMQVSNLRSFARRSFERGMQIHMRSKW